MLGGKIHSQYAFVMRDAISEEPVPFQPLICGSTSEPLGWKRLVEEWDPQRCVINPVRQAAPEPEGQLGHNPWRSGRLRPAPNFSSRSLDRTLFKVAQRQMVKPCDIAGFTGQYVVHGITQSHFKPTHHSKQRFGKPYIMFIMPDCSPSIAMRNSKIRREPIRRKGSDDGIQFINAVHKVV